MTCLMPLAKPQPCDGFGSWLPPPPCASAAGAPTTHVSVSTTNAPTTVLRLIDPSFQFRVPYPTLRPGGPQGNVGSQTRYERARARVDPRPHEVGAEHRDGEEH